MIDDECRSNPSCQQGMYDVAKAHMLRHAGRRAKPSANRQQIRDDFQPNKKKLVLKRERG